MSQGHQEKLRGLHYRSSQPIEVTMKNGMIKDIRQLDGHQNYENIISPGLVDLQINGYKGYDFNESPLNSKEWETVIYNLSKVGVTTFYPTIITNSMDNLKNIFRSNINNITENNLNSFIGGFHLEGPFISNVDGPRGAHDPHYVRKPDWEDFKKLQEYSNGNIRIVTLSPEWKEAEKFIYKANQNGVKVAIGHTSANSTQIERASESGAILSTHLGNGAHLKLPRHPNYLWDQLSNENLWASVIADGHHLPINVLKIFNKVKGQNMIIVSDSVSLAGLAPGKYKQKVGGYVTLTDEGRLYMNDEPNLLAGSAQSLLKGIENLVSNNITKLHDAINKASVYPSQLMGLPQKDGLQKGAPADILLLKQSEQKLRVLKTFKNGKCIYKEGELYETNG